MKIKKVNELSNYIIEGLDDKDNGLDVYTQVWTIIKHGDTEIYKIYTDKKDAEIAAELKTKEMKDYSRKTNKNMTDKEFDEYYKNSSWNAFHKIYQVKTLADAIDLIKESIYDDYASHDNPSY